MKITLSNTEMSCVYSIAGHRHTANSVFYKDINASQYDKSRYTLDIIIEGVMAEYAWCKWRNIFMSWDCSPRSGGCDSYEKGRRYDIKGTREKNGHLVASKKENPDVTHFVLGIIEGTTVDFVGYYLASELYGAGIKEGLGRGENYMVSQDKLLKFKCDLSNGNQVNEAANGSEKTVVGK